MANYRMVVKVQMANEWLMRFKLFFEELRKYGCRELPNGTFEIDDRNLESINSLAVKYQLQIQLIKL